MTLAIRTYAIIMHVNNGNGMKILFATLLLILDVMTGFSFNSLSEIPNLLQSNCWSTWHLINGIFKSYFEKLICLKGQAN